MVNKTAVGLLGVVVVASLGVGVLIGMQLGGGAQTATNATPGSDTTTATPVDGENGSASDSNSTSETATPADGTTEQQTTIPARQFDEDEVATHIATFVNEERTEAGRIELLTDDATGESVSELSRNHSVNMANAGQVAHDVGNGSTAARYKRFELFERCKFKSPEGSYIRQPDEKFELLGSTHAGVHYQDDGEEQFNADERDVARAIVDDWNESSTYSERMLVEGPEHMGVGVEVTQSGTVYATLDVCA